MTREEIISKIALKMDEISSSDDLILSVGTGDNNPLYAQINGLLNETINDVLMKAPIFRIGSCVESESHTEKEAIFNGLRNVSRFNLPYSFLRLVSITDPLFQRPIVDFSIEGDEVDKRQRNKFLVAKYAKPVAVISVNKGHRVVTCYSYNPADTPNITMTYIKRFDGTENDETMELPLSDELIDVVAWACAGRVFAAQGDVNRGKICDENAAALLI